MATSPAQLLEDVARRAARSGADVASAEDSIRALHHLGRALAELAPAQVGARTARRGLFITELARVCEWTAAQWPPGVGPVSELAGVSADSIVSRTRGLDDDERWTAAVEVGRVASACADAATRFGPYANIPTLAPVIRLTTAMNRMATLDPPRTGAGAWLDRHIPSTALTADASPATRVIDAAAGLVGALERELDEGRLHVYSALAASAVAEICARHAESIASVIGHRPADVQTPSASRGWQIVQAALIRFDDGSRHGAAPRSQVSECALTLNRALTSFPGAGSDRRTLGDAVTAVRYCANQLPAIASLVTDAMQRLTDSGRLFARARNLPRSEEHVLEVIHDKVVVVMPRDIGPVLMSTRATGRLSMALALDLDRSAGRIGAQPQPRLIAALRSSMQPELHARDTRWAERLAARCDSVRPGALSR